MNNIAIIDIGSNSVRIRISSNGNVFFRDTITTRLAEGMKDGKLAYKSVIRTFEGLDRLIFKAKKCGADIFAFATAAVRNSVDGKEFTDEFFCRYGIAVDVLSGEAESETGINGAIGNGDGLVIDVGGASTEIAVRENGKIVYAHSVPVGAVLLTDNAGKDFEKAKAFLAPIVGGFGIVPKIGCDGSGEKASVNTSGSFESSGEHLCDGAGGSDCSGGKVYAIGGTATSISFMMSGDRAYDRDKNHGRIIDSNALATFCGLLYSMTSEEIEKRFNVPKKRAEIIHSGALILSTVLGYIGSDYAIVSENDNLEGYYDFVTGKKYGEAQK